VVYIIITTNNIAANIGTIREIRRNLMIQPFLTRYAKPCLSPNRGSNNPNYLYDENIDMVRWLGSSDCIPVIEAYLLGDGPDDPPKTKKFDIEKGEDQKDRLMWRRP
jgi:hypothetical protein